MERVRGSFSPLIGGLNNTQQSNLMSSVAGLLQDNGGIQGLMEKFDSAGLGDLIKCWVSTGPNPPARPQQVEQVFGAAQFDEMAAQTGIAREQIADHVAETLPRMVDKLTPDGEPLGDNDLPLKLSSLVQDGLEKLFG